MKRIIRTLLLSAAAAGMLTACGQKAPVQVQDQKARVIVTCDPELDDNNSMIRFLLFATDFDIEGIVLTSSQFHWKGDGKGTTQFIPGAEYDRGNVHLGPQTEWRWYDDFMDNLIAAYEEAYPNLAVHDSRYPTPEYIKSVTKVGNIYFQGDYSYDSDGSQLIKKVLLDDEPGPVFVQAWGGASSIAAALRSIADEYEGTPEWDSIYEKVSGKMVFCGGDQDNALNGYIRVKWPDIHIQSVSGSFMPIAYNGQDRLPDSLKFYFEPEWVAENLRIGPFGKLQRVWGDGVQYSPGDIYDYFWESGKTADQLRAEGYVVWSNLQKKGSFLAEGDSGCFLNQIDNGLRAWEDESWGGWSGRREPGAATSIMTFGGGDSSDEDVAAAMRRRMGPDPVLPNFFPEAMDQLAARFHWSATSDYDACNHYPVVNGPHDISAAPGETVRIQAEVGDPDGDSLDLRWWQFKVGSYEGDCAVDDPASPVTTFTVPADARPGDTIHLILEANDNGQPNLKRYLRTIITVK